MKPGTATLETLAQEWEEFKARNDQAISDQTAESKVIADRVNDQLTDILSRLDEEKREREAIEKIVNRPGATQQTIEADIHIRDFVSLAQDLDLADVVVDDAARQMYSGYRKAFDVYLRKGDNVRHIQDELSVGSNPNGGYWVDPALSGRIIEFVRETSPMRQLATIETIGTDALEGDYDLQDIGTGGWVNETSTRTGNTDTPNLGMWRIPVHEQYAEPRTTQQMLDDSRRDVAAWLIAKTTDKFSRDENTSFVTGATTAKPRGFATYSSGTPDPSGAVSAYTVIRQVNSGSAAAIAADGLIDLVFAVKAAYRANGNFAMNSSTLAEVRKLKDGSGAYIWQPDFTQARQDRLLGYGITEFEDMADIAANALPIGFGDFRRAYTIVDRAGITVLRDPFTLKGRVKFYTTKRVGGDVVDFDAIVLQKVAA